MYSLEQIKTGKGGKNSISLVFQGDLNLLNLNKIEKEVKAVPEDFSEYTIKIEKVTDIDIPFLQLIHSFATSMKKKKKEVEVELDVDGENKLMIKKSGFLNNNEFIRN